MQVLALRRRPVRAVRRQRLHRLINNSNSKPQNRETDIQNKSNFKTQVLDDGSLFGVDPCGQCASYGYTDGSADAYAVGNSPIGKCSAGDPTFKYAVKTGTTSLQMDNDRMMVGSDDPVTPPCTPPVYTSYSHLPFASTIHTSPSNSRSHLPFTPLLLTSPSHHSFHLSFITPHTSNAYLPFTPSAHTPPSHLTPPFTSPFAPPYTPPVTPPCTPPRTSIHTLLHTSSHTLIHTSSHTSLHTSFHTFIYTSFHTSI